MRLRGGGDLDSDFLEKDQYELAEPSHSRVRIFSNRTKVETDFESPQRFKRGNKCHSSKRQHR